MSGTFQYRKRYGLHAINEIEDDLDDIREFQYRKRYGLHAIEHGLPEPFECPVSIPQAVWIACNPIMFFTEWDKVQFQYRKRYGLHAIRSF